jgi:hypothetical protein
VREQEDSVDGILEVWKGTSRRRQADRVCTDLFAVRKARRSDRAEAEAESLSTETACESDRAGALFELQKVVEECVGDWEVMDLEGSELVMAAVPQVFGRLRSFSTGSCSLARRPRLRKRLTTDNEVSAAARGFQKIVEFAVGGAQ